MNARQLLVFLSPVLLAGCGAHLRSVAELAASPSRVVMADAARVSSSAATKAPAARWQDARIELATYGAYSPASRTGERLWLGGWASASDPETYLRQMRAGVNPGSVWGPDKIYVTTLSGSLDRTAAAVRLALALPGYHVNDPTLVAPPSTDGVDRSKWLLMYFTMLDNHLAEACRRSGKELVDCRDLFEGHDIGMASSVDGGLSWTYRGIVVKAAASGDGRGAWMPSAIVEGNEIHLYYNTGTQDYRTSTLYRQRLNANGVTGIGRPQLVRFADFKLGDLYVNVDVKARTTGTGRRVYLMVANSADQKRIHGFLSADGVNFTELAESPLLSAQGTDSVLLTPDIYEWGENGLSAPTVAGGHGAGGDAPGFVFLNFSRKGASSAFEFRRHDGIRFTIPARFR